VDQSLTDPHLCRSPPVCATAQPGDRHILTAGALPTPALPCTLLGSAPSQERVKSRIVANIKSQIKRNRQNEKRRVRNKAVRSELRTRQKAVLAAVEAGDDPTEAMRVAQRKLDKAAQAGVIHANEAARRKARLLKRIHAAQA